MKTITRLLSIFFLLGFMGISNLAGASIKVTFYSHDFDDHFPHAFFSVQGNFENGSPINKKFGFTAKKISPAILLGSVQGRISAPSPKYIQKSNPHFTIVLNDQEYVALLTVVETWQNKSGKSYNLKKHNCVHFIRDALVALGYKVNPKSKYYKKPKSFLREVTALNPGLQTAPTIEP